MAGVSYYFLHGYASIPVAISVGNLSSTFVDAVFRPLAGIGQVVVPTICIAAAGTSAWRRNRRAALVEHVTSSDAASSLEDMTWQEFETLVGESFRLRGYHVMDLGGSTPDGGIDLILMKGSETFLVQCKQWKAQAVTVEIVRELYGVMAARGAAGGFVVTSGRFTKDAIAFTQGRNLTLIDGPKLFDLIKRVQANRVAEAGTSKPKVITSTPSCPRCGATMVKREAKRGPNSGGTFWGCSSYPACRGTRPN